MSAYSTWMIYHDWSPWWILPTVVRLYTPLVYLYYQLLTNICNLFTQTLMIARANFRFAPSQWETELFCNDVSHRLGTSPESALLASLVHINSLPPRQNGHHFTDDIFECIFMIGKFGISFRISPKFVLDDQVDTNSTFCEVMAWRRTGDKTLPEPMLTQFAEFIYDPVQIRAT